MYNNITELKDIHSGKDIWIVCEGSSMNYVESDFFENKITIGLNQVYKHFPCDYVVMKDLRESSRFDASVEELEDTTVKLLFSRHSHGAHRDPENKPKPCDNFYVFDHNDNRQGIESALNVIGTESMTVIRSTMTTIMKLSYVIL